MDALRFLEAEHREVDELMSRLETLQTQAAGSGTAHLEERHELITQIMRDLARHAAVEEMHLYPVLRERGAENLVEKALEQHREAKEALDEVDGVSPDAKDFDEHVRALSAGVREHVAFEEGTMFPRLREVLGDDELRELGDKLQKSELRAPTHAHPKAPSTPPGNKMLGPVAGLVDRLRDALSGRR